MSCYPAPPPPAPRNQLLANNIVVGRWLGEAAQNILETQSGHRVLLQPGTTSGTFAPVRTEIFYPLVQCQGEPFSYAMAIGQAVYPLSGDRPFATKDGRLLGRTQARSVLLPTGCSNIEHWEQLNPQAAAPTLDNSSSARVGNFLLFQASNGLWVTNGSPQGTVLLRQFSSSPNSFMVHNSVVYFVAASETGSQALWSSDGTVAGTKMVSDPNVGNPNAWFEFRAIINGRAILANTSGTTTSLVAIALTGGAVTTLQEASTTCPNYGLYGESAAVGSTLYVVYNEHDSACVLINQSILSTNGFTVNARAADIAPTSAIESYGLYSHLSALGSTLIFRANNSTSGDELWSFNGTSTVLLKDINAGNDGSEPQPLFTLGSALFFSAQDATGARAIYRTDGTSAGTTLFRSFPAGGNNAGVDISHFKASPTVVYVAARRSSSAPFSEIWRTDGTTRVDLAPWPIEASANLWNAVTDTSGTVYFSGYTATHGGELFRISGTTISLFADIAAGPASFNPQNLAMGLDGRLYFASENVSDYYSGTSRGGDLWSTNGTPSGTRRVLWRALEDGLGLEGRMIPLNGGLVFKAKRPDMGTERVLLTYRPGILNTFPSEGMTAVLPLSAPLIAPGGMLTLVP